jgi:hypothetical protein
LNTCDPIWLSSESRDSAASRVALGRAVEAHEPETSRRMSEVKPASALPTTGHGGDAGAGVALRTSTALRG